MIRTFFAGLVALLGIAAAVVYASAFIVHQNEQSIVLSRIADGTHDVDGHLVPIERYVLPRS